MNIQMLCGSGYCILHALNHMYIREKSAVAVTVVDDKAVCSGGGGGEMAAVLLSTMSGVPEGMTKTQWKKQLRQQRKMLKWERSKWVEFSMGTYIYTVSQTNNYCMLSNL